MKHNEWENDGFDELLRDALASDAAPSGDFTERLMEQVRRTPQEKAKNRPYKKILGGSGGLRRHRRGDPAGDASRQHRGPARTTPPP